MWKYELKASPHSMSSKWQWFPMHPHYDLCRGNLGLSVYWQIPCWYGHWASDFTTAGTTCNNQNEHCGGKETTFRPLKIHRLEVRWQLGGHSSILGAASCMKGSLISQPWAKIISDVWESNNNLTCMWESSAFLLSAVKSLWLKSYSEC